MSVYSTTSLFKILRLRVVPGGEPVRNRRTSLAGRQ